MLETRLKNNSYASSTIKTRETMYNKIDENGLNGYQQAYWKGREKIDTKELSLKAAKTMEDTTLENGLSIKEDRLIRAHETKSKIGEDGLTTYQRAGLKIALVDKRIFYKVDIYDSNDNLYRSYEKIQMKELISSSELPIKVMWYSEKYKVSRNTRKYYKPYEGFYLIKEKLNEN